MTLTQSPQLAVRLGTWNPHSGKLEYSTKVYAVESIKEASDKWCALRDATGMGASESPIVTVVDLNTGDEVAKVSYNGRVWDSAGKEIPCS